MDLKREAETLISDSMKNASYVKVGFNYTFLIDMVTNICELHLPFSPTNANLYPPK